MKRLYSVIKKLDQEDLRLSVTLSRAAFVFLGSVMLRLWSVTSNIRE